METSIEVMDAQLEVFCRWAKTQHLVLTVVKPLAGGRIVVLNLSDDQKVLAQLSGLKLRH